MVSFAVQKLLSLIRSHLFIFVLCPQVKCLDFPKSFYPALFWDLRFSICVSQSTLLSPGVCGSAVPCSVYSVHHCFFGFQPGIFISISILIFRSSERQTSQSGSPKTSQNIPNKFYSVPSKESKRTDNGLIATNSASPHWKRNQFSSGQFSCSVMSDSLLPHELQQARPPCPAPTPGVHSNSCPSSQ